MKPPSDEAMKAARELFVLRDNGCKAGGPPYEPDEWIGWKEIWLGETMIAELSHADDGDEAYAELARLEDTVARTLDAFAEQARKDERERLASKLEANANKMRGVMVNDPATITWRSVAEQIRANKFIEVDE